MGKLSMGQSISENRDSNTHEPYETELKVAGGRERSNHDVLELETQNFQPRKAPAQLMDYLTMTRPDYWLKNIFIIPGLFFALAVYETAFTSTLVFNIIAGFLSSIFIVSANYVIN